MRTLRSLALLLLLATNLRAAVPLPPESEQWTALTAGELRIYSNASPHATLGIATNLLRMREAVGKVTTLAVYSPKPTYVLIFRTEASFAPYRDALFHGQDAPVSGAFLSGRAASFIAVNAAAEGGVARLVYHELTHHFMRNTIPGLPLWLDEGLAEYHSTFSVRGHEVRIGAMIPEHVRLLRSRRPLIPLERHFAIDQQSPEYTDPAQQRRFYAQSWALVHSFYSGGPERRARLEAFLDAIRSGRSAAEATPLLGSDYPAMGVELMTYVRRPSMTFTSYRLDELVVPALDAPRPLARGELLYALGSMLAADGEALLAEAVRVDPSHAEAHAMLGYAHQARGDHAGALALFEKAVRLGSRDEALRDALRERDSTAVRGAQRRYEEGNEEQAIAAMQAVLERTTDEELKEHLQGVIGVHEDKLRIKAMNDIIAAAQAGKTKEALALIDARLAKTTDEEERAQLLAMRSGVRRP
jgi:tetratricopeptide (TPR) repeat protein